MGTDREREGSNPILTTLDSMRQHGLTLLILASLVLAPLLIAAPEALRMHAHEGVVYTSDQTWSGDMSLVKTSHSPVVPPSRLRQEPTSMSPKM